MTEKQQIMQTMETLPEEANIEDAIERLCLLLKVQRGISQAEAGETFSQEEAKRRMARWLK